MNKESLSSILGLIICLTLFIVLGYKIFLTFGLISSTIIFVIDTKSVEYVKSVLKDNIEIKNHYLFISYFIFWPVFIPTHMILRGQHIDKQE